MSLTYDLTGNTIVADAVTGDVTGDVTGTVDFPSADLDDPGTNAGTGPATFDKVLRISVNGVDYFVGLYDDND